MVILWFSNQVYKEKAYKRKKKMVHRLAWWEKGPIFIYCEQNMQQMSGGTWLNLMKEQSYVSLFITLDTYPFLDGLPKTKIFMVWVQSIPISSESATPPLSALSVFISVPFKRCQWLMILQKMLEGKRVQCKSLGRENKQSPKTHPILHG